MPDGTTRLLKNPLGPDHPEQQRLAWIYSEVKALLQECPEGTIIAKEAPFMRSLGPSVVLLAAVHGILAAAVEEVFPGEPVIQISPTTLKKHATGGGKATKDDMVMAASQRGFLGGNDDEADAYLVWHWARQQRVETPTPPAEAGGADGSG
jgi:Holliday junction resolvasome RuvABC endonuclease subunit